MTSACQGGELVDTEVKRGVGMGLGRGTMGEGDRWKPQVLMTARAGGALSLQQPFGSRAVHTTAWRD